MAAGTTSLDKFNILRQTITNWPLVLLDKLGLVETCQYRTKTGQRFLCRSKSTDINEVVVVMSGAEYPAKYLGVHDGQTVFDLGANIGSFAVYFDGLNPGVKYRGFAFEPFKDNFGLLKSNIAANKVQNFELIEAAVSDVDGMVRIDTAVSPDAVSITDGQGTDVVSYKLSSFCRQHKIDQIDLLKMDIEGAEYAIFETDYEFLKQSVKVVILEYHVLSEKLNVDWIMERTAGDFVSTTIHTNQMNGVIVLENKRLGQYVKGAIL